MKTQFKHYSGFSPADIKELWHNALIILDTNILLDFYSFGGDTLEDYYTVLRKAKEAGKIWLPYQIGYEFHENRMGIITKQINQYDNIIQYLDKASDQILNLTNSSPNHSHLDFKEISDDYVKRIKPLRTKIEKLKKSHPDYLGQDDVLNELEQIFDDEVVGQQYNNQTLDEIYAEGEIRYSKRIPPGYKDENKKENENDPAGVKKYGDLVIWKQIIQQAKDTKRPVIFVTNDAKDDWILRAKDGRRLGAKPLLKKEMLEVAGVDFILYSSDEFLEEAHTQFALPVKEESLQEVKKHRELEFERANVIQNINQYSYRHLYETLGDKRYSLDRLRHEIHRVRRLAREAQGITQKINAPDRLLKTFVEIEYVLRRMSQALLRGDLIQATSIREVEMLLRLAGHITDSMEEFDRTVIREMKISIRDIASFANFDIQTEDQD